MERITAAMWGIYRSISSLPTVMAVVMILLACWQASTTDSPTDLSAGLDRFDVKDLDTIRSILAAVIGGVFTLTVFAYTMVMNVLDRSIASYSPRLVPLVLSQRYHQVLLGFSVGTIAHATILLLVTADDANTPYPPVLAAFSAGCLAIFSLLIFIYYIHRVSQTIHVNALLELSFEQTKKNLLGLRKLKGVRLAYETNSPFPDYSGGIAATQAGYLVQLRYEQLPALARKVGGDLVVGPALGSFIHPGELLLSAASDRVAALRKYESDLTFGISAEVPDGFHTTGFKHLVEVAVKAMSPAINDPGTSLTALHYLTELFRIYAEIGNFNQVIGDEGGVVWIRQYTLAELRDECFRELKAYMKSDPWAGDAYERALTKVNGYIRSN